MQGFQNVQFLRGLLCKNPSENGHLTPDEEVELEIHYDEKKSGDTPEFSNASLELEPEEISVRETGQEVTE